MPITTAADDIHKYFSLFSEKIRLDVSIAADDMLIFYFNLSKKIRLDFSYESSAEHMKNQALFSSKD